MIEGAIRTGGVKGLSGELPGHVHFGIQGPTGGHYIPTIKQTGGQTAEISFTPSQEDMPPVAPVEIELPVGTGEVNLTDYAKEQWVNDNYQPKGNYLTKVPDEYAKKSDIPEAGATQEQENQIQRNANDIALLKNYGGNAVFYMSQEVEWPEPETDDGGIHFTASYIKKQSLSNSGVGVKTGDMIVASNGTICKVTSVSSIDVGYEPIGTINGVIADGGNDSGGNVDLTGVVKSVNGQTPDENGNVEIAVSGGTATATAALPILYLVGDTTAMTKETRVDLRYTYVDSVKNEQRTGWCDCKWQGETSTAKPKKNYTIRFYNDPDHAKKDKIEYGGLTKASKWVTKANYVDQSHARNIVSARLWSDIVHSRSGELPTEMQESALNYGAIDGYPILIYLNGAYLGLYTMNIPKDEKLFGMDTDNPKHCALCGYSNNNGDNSVVLSTQFRTVNTNDWENEVPEAWNDTNTAALTNLVNFVKDSTDDEFVTNLNTYLDVESAIDYYIFMYFNGGIDSLGRNLVILTYDGVKWYCSGYDMDMCFGNNFSGTGVLSPTTACPEGYRETNSLLWQRLEALFGNAIYNRYTALRQTVLSTEYVNRAFGMFISQIPKSEYESDYKKWPGMGQAGVDHLAQITAWVEARAAYVDEQMLAFTEEIPCESMTLSADSLTFIVEEAQTLTANVTPANTTDRVVWATSNEDVATVSKGVVTPVGNGSCVITATCGNFSDECAVTVNAFTEIATDLPEGYTQLDYIVCDGAATYFDTSVTPSTDLRLNAKVQPTESALARGAYIAGAYQSSLGGTTWRMYNGQYGHNIQLYLMGAINNGNKFTPIGGTDYVIETDENMKMSINGTVIFDHITAGTSTYDDAPIVLFNTHRVKSADDSVIEGYGSEVWGGHVYYVKLHKGTELVADYVPCINPDGVVGMYDLVTATFHGSEGTAQFAAPA